MIKGVSKQELVDRKVIAAGTAYDFNGWYWALVAQNEVLERVKVDTSGVEERAKEI